MVVDDEETPGDPGVKGSKDLIVYSAEELMRLQKAPLSQKWPPYLDEAFKSIRGQWDPDQWHQNKKRYSTPPPDQDKKDKKENDESSGTSGGTATAGLNKVLI